MKVRLAYGKHGLWVDLPDRNVTVVEPRYVPGVPDEAEAVRAALRAPIGSPPLRELVKPSDTVAIVFSDLTRPQPRDRMLPILLDEIGHVPRANIVLINALGTHRPNTPDELAAMLGREVVEHYRVVQHDAWARDLVYLGRTSYGHEVSVNAEYMRADVRILTGFIEPHFFAGFSGGPKAVLPGIADAGAVLGNHDARMIGDPRATWGITEGNPVWEEMREVALMTAPTFLLNVTLNRDRQITGVFAGDMLQAHAVGTKFAAEAALVPVPQPFDIVITSNSGYPLDLNLYQAVKGMSAAAQVVKTGGSIIVAAECWDGIPDHGEFKRLLQLAPTPGELLEVLASFEHPVQDQWEAQIQAQVQMKADVYVRSDYLDAATLRSVMLQPCDSIEATVARLLERYGPDATICVLPEGPMTIPCVRGQV
ncbi:MAG: nickel-dependent lactate racemase [Anaerolineales bacterium]